MAAARSNERSILALSALMSALATDSTWPPARKWASSCSTGTSIPAFTSEMRGLTMATGGTRRSRMPMMEPRLTLAPAARALTHSPTGTK